MVRLKNVVLERATFNLLPVWLDHIVNNSSGSLQEGMHFIIRRLLSLI